MRKWHRIICVSRNYDEAIKTWKMYIAGEHAYSVLWLRLSDVNRKVLSESADDQS